MVFFPGFNGGKWETQIRKLFMVHDQSHSTTTVVFHTPHFDRARHYHCQAQFLVVFLKSKFFNKRFYSKSFTRLLAKSSLVRVLIKTF